MSEGFVSSTKLRPHTAENPVPAALLDAFMVQLNQLLDRNAEASEMTEAALCRINGAPLPAGAPPGSTSQTRPVPMGYENRLRELIDRLEGHCADRESQNTRLSAFI